MPRRPLGDKPMTNAERQRRWRERLRQKLLELGPEEPEEKLKRWAEALKTAGLIMIEGKEPKGASGVVHRRQ